MEGLWDVSELTGIDDAKVTWIARKNSADASEDQYEFLHMMFESVVVVVVEALG